MRDERQIWEAEMRGRSEREADLRDERWESGRGGGWESEKVR
jgi:hypothetical protein